MSARDKTRIRPEHELEVALRDILAHNEILRHSIQSIKDKLTQSIDSIPYVDAISEAKDEEAPKRTAPALVRFRRLRSSI